VRTRIAWFAALAVVFAVPGAAGAQVSGESGGTEPGHAGGRIDVASVRMTAGGKDVSTAPVDREIELHVTLMNYSENTAQDVAMRLDSGTEGVRMTQSNASFGTIAAGATATGVYAFQVARAACTGWAGFVGSIVSSLGEDVTKLGIEVQCPGPKLAVESVRYRGGDGDEIPEPGERLTIDVTLKNYGIDPATGVTGSLSVQGPVTVRENTSRWPDLAPGASAVSSSPFVIEIAADAELQQDCGNTGGVPVTSLDTAVSSAETPQTVPAEGGTVEPKSDDPAVESDYQSVSFEATLALASNEGKFTEGFGTAMACAMADAAAGRPAALGRAESTAKGSKTPTGRTGTIVVIVVLTLVAGAVFARYRFSR